MGAVLLFLVETELQQMHAQPKELTEPNLTDNILFSMPPYCRLFLYLGKKKFDAKILLQTMRVVHTNMIQTTIIKS